MKIVQTPARFYPAVGGVEKYVLDLSKELVKQGNEVKVICANEPDSKIKNFKGIKIERLNYCGKITNTNLTWSLFNKLKNEEFDVIHTHIPTPWSADISRMISKKKDKPLILTYHNDLIKKGFANIIASLYSSTFLKILLNQADKIIITQPEYINYSKYLKKYKNKIVVIPNAIDISKFKNISTKKENNSIFFLSVLDKFHRYKGLDYLLNALVEIKKNIPSIKLYVAGRGELLAEYKELTKRLDLESNVIFLGYVSDEELIKYYNKSNAFVLPSIDHNEGFGIVLLESLACKTPVITTDIVGISKEIKKDNCGLVVKSKNSNALVEAIIKILKNSKLAKQMGENGRKLVEQRYNWKNVAKEVEKVYRSVLRK